MLVRFLTKPSLQRVSYLPRCTTCRSIASFARRRARAAAQKAKEIADAESDWAADSPADVLQIPIRQPDESDALRAELRERRAARWKEAEEREKEPEKAEERDAEPDWSWGSSTDVIQTPPQRAAGSDVLPTSASPDFTASKSPAQAVSTEKTTEETAEEGAASEELLGEHTGSVPHVEISPKPTRMGVFGSYRNAYANSPLRVVDGHKPVWNGRILQIRPKTQLDTDKTNRFDERWLRDHCQCSQCFHPLTKQRQINIFTLKDQASFNISECIVGDTSVEIDWQDGHHSHYPMHLFTYKESFGHDWQAYRRGLDMSPRLWNASVGKQAPAVDYDSVQRNGVGELLRQIRIFGFCFVPNCPVNPEATQSLLEMIGPIRNTHYGGFYDFTSDMASKDTAYTDLALEAHTDTTYFSEPAGLQAFHMLSHTGGEGGKSLLVDGFNAANELLHANKLDYRWLSFTGVYAHASGNESVSIQPHTAFPVLEHDRFHQGYLYRVRWNNSDRAGLRMLPGNTKAWYQAARSFNDILASAQNQYWFQLQPGTPLIFDNWRVLHGRSAFTGKRRMCGAYINHDDFISKYRLTNYTTEDVMATTISGF
ncbi:hypothetical protein MBLNU457_6033t1 [Dothideomycetes sp. NU457]